MPIGLKVLQALETKATPPARPGACPHNFSVIERIFERLRFVRRLGRISPETLQRPDFGRRQIRPRPAPAGADAIYSSTGAAAPGLKTTLQLHPLRLRMAPANGPGTCAGNVLLVGPLDLAGEARYRSGDDQRAFQSHAVRLMVSGRHCRRQLSALARSGHSRHARRTLVVSVVKMRIVRMPVDGATIPAIVGEQLARRRVSVVLKSILKVLPAPRARDRTHLVRVRARCRSGGPTAAVSPSTTRV